MARWSYLLEAETCRRQAAAYLGRPEAPFLLRVARAFEQLAVEEHRDSGKTLRA